MSKGKYSISISQGRVAHDHDNRDYTPHNADRGLRNRNERDNQADRGLQIGVQ